MAASYGQQPMPGAGGMWARAQLTRGQSASPTWAVDGQVSQVRLTVGSAPDAGWPIQGPGIQPYHVELFWDGQSIWVADTYRVGGVAVDGRPVSDWVQVRGRAEVSFGSASLQIETAGAASAEMASDPVGAQRVTVAPGESWGSSFSVPPESQWGDESLSGEATRVAAAPSESEDWKDLEGESTRIAPEGAPLVMPVPAAQPRSVPPPPQRPRLGAAPAPVAPPPPPGRDMARTITGDDMSHVVASAQRAAQQAAPSVMVQPGYPAPPASGFGQPTAPPGGFGQPTAPPGGFGQAGFGAGGYASPGAPPPAAPAPIFNAPAAAPAPSPAFGAPAFTGAGAPPGPGGFAAPPGFDQAPAPVRKNDFVAKLKAIPPRTLALGGATVVVLLGVLLMTGGEDPEPAPPVTQPAAQAAQPTPTPSGTPGAGAESAVAPQPGYPPPQPGYPQPLEAIQAANPQPLPPTVQAIPTTPPPPTAPPATATTGEPGAAEPTPDRIAADLVVTGRYAEALPHYQQLAAAHPERPEYARMVRVLQQRLAARCAGGVGPDGRSCLPQ